MKNSIERNPKQMSERSQLKLKTQKDCDFCRAESKTLVEFFDNEENSFSLVCEECSRTG